MGLQITKFIDNHWELQQEFRDYNRDYYPEEVYAELIRYFDAFNAPVELDVIEICSSLNDVTIEDYCKENHIKLKDFDEDDVYYDLNVLTIVDDVIYYWE